MMTLEFGNTDFFFFFLLELCNIYPLCIYFNIFLLSTLNFIFEKGILFNFLSQMMAVFMRWSRTDVSKLTY